MKRDLLYVDDENDNLVVFEMAFEDDFNIHSATSAREALRILERTPIPVVVSDQRMPEMTGVEMFAIMRRQYPHIQRIILTGYTDPDGMIEAINQGQVFHFVKKPWERPFLLSVLIRAFEAHDMAVANSSLTDQLVLSERLALLGQATARLTHEIGNQLCLLPMIEFIEEKYSDQLELCKMASLARESMQRLTGLIREVKEFMRFDQHAFSRQPIALVETIHDLVSFLRFDKSIPSQKLKVQVDSEPVVLGNKVKLQQVLVNLIKNAAHAIRERPEGQITVTLGSEGGSAVVRVSDTGCGMTPEVLTRIWDPYFTTKGSEGTGLGLDISRKIIEAHGGAIDCSSTTDVGTCFVVRIPLAVAELGAA